MNIPMENSTASPMELDIGHTVESFQQFLESQKDLFHSQIDQLEKIVVTQCKLTGVNPLSQEMAAGALSIKIGKRPRDLLNPKAVKYMQSVFSIKDTISKKETREISALCGVTVTQVREFFAGQRSRVRKVVRLSREKAIRFSACKTSDDGSCVKSESDVPVSHETSSNSDQQNVKEEETSLNPDHKIIKDAETFLNLEHKNVKDAETFLNSEHKNVKDAETCSTSQEETIPGLDSSENFFVENIFNLMRKEDTFSGQVKLLQSILRIHNSAVLNWFLTKGGMMILAKWLSEAALEEQTTVLLVILKVLCRLPLHKALPAQMSAILQTVNRLRFYRTSDISNRAKVLLSRWSKLFVRSQALKKLSPANARSDAQKEMIHNQRISEILGDNSWQSKLEIPELFSLNENFSKSCRKLENAGAVKLLPPPSCDSNKKSSRNITSSNNKERRKVQLVEQPSRNVARSGSVAKMASVKHSRPMSADDIQKAKMRAIFMQSKYALRGESSTHNNQQKTETSKISSDISECQKNCSSITNNKLGDAKTSMMEKQQDQKPASVLICQTLPPTEYITDPQSSLALQHADLQSNACQNDNVLQPSCAENIDLKPSVAPQEHDFEPTVTLEGPDLKLKSVLQEPNSKSCMACEVSDLMLHSGLEEKLLWERLKKVQIPWHMPPEIRVSSQWSLGAGENSKEIEVQTERIRREKETVYQSNQDIPSDPKEPWDVEMDYDDSLTPEIPTEQPPDGQSEASPEAPSTDATSDVTSATAENSKTPEPDLELLAVLLKNPDLVFALTSSQGSSISNGQIVQVLDMLKASGLSGSVNGLAVNGAEQQKSILSQNPVSPSPPTPLSLPSPTPASLPSPTPDPSSRWSFDSAMTLKVPGMTRISQPVVAGASTALSPVPSYAASMPNLVSHQAPVSVASVPERSVSTRSLPPQSSVSAPPWKEVPPEVPKVYQEASIAARPLATVTQLTQNASSTLQQFPAQRLGAANHGRPGNTVLAPVSLGMNHPPMERPVTTYSLPSTASTAPRTQQAFPELMPYSPQYTPWSRNYPQISTQESPSEPGHSRANGFASNRASNAHFVANQSNYNAYLAGPSEPVFETWSPERAIPQAQPDGNFSTRRNSGWSNERTERSRHNNNQAQRWGSRTGNKRWHERGRRY